MGKTSLEQRRQIQEMAGSNQTAAAIAEALDISIWTVRKWQQRLKKGVRCIRTWVVQLQVS